MLWEAGQSRTVREAEQQASLIETSTLHAFASVMVKGYADRRARERRRGAEPASFSGKANLEGWQRLAQIAAKTGRLQTGGERLVN